MKNLRKAMVLILAFTLVFSLAGCSSKTAITADKFEDILEDEGYDVSVSSSETLSYNNDYDIDEMRYASDDNDYPIVIFIEFGSLDDAKDFFKTTADQEKDKIKDEDLDAKTTTKSSGNYEKFTIQGEMNDGMEACSVMIRINNTAIIAVIDGDSSADVKVVEDIVSKLGY